MIIGVPKETHHHEHRVGLTPFGASRLVRQGHTVVVEQGAGVTAHFFDVDYEKAGAQIVFSSEEAFRRADLVCGVEPVTAEELEQLKPGSILCNFQHLAVAPRDHVERLMQLGTTAVGYEIIRDAEGHLAVLTPFSEMAGLLAVQVAGHLLQIESGGRGILLGNVPGVPPATVVILGAGTVGHAAARHALAAGAHVIVLDHDLSKLRALDQRCPGIVTVIAGVDRLERYTAVADVVIGAVLIPGGRAPIVVTEQMVRSMKPGSVIIDVSIDQGGCVETCRPTTLDRPTYTVHDVVHYSVPNMTANIARTASRVLSSAALPNLLELAQHGPQASLSQNPGLAAGTYMYEGSLVNERTGGTLGFPVTPLGEALTKGSRA
jgi:alanine dehydrogenase